MLFLSESLEYNRDFIFPKDSQDIQYTHCNLTFSITPGVCDTTLHFKLHLEDSEATAASWKVLDFL